MRRDGRPSDFHTHLSIMNNALSRRKFLASSSMAGAAFWIGPGRLPGQAKVAANDKLNIAMVGTAGQAGGNIDQVASPNIVALCDVDDRNLAAAAKQLPNAICYTTIRRMLERSAMH